MTLSVEDTAVINSLKDSVTHFSEQLRLNASHMDEVTVGGEVQSIIAPVLEKSSSDLQSFYVVELDDKVGSLYVYVSKLMFDCYSEVIKTGSMLTFNGYANIITRTVKEKVIRECSVVAYDVKRI
jgi:hypothetical protein